MQENRLDGQESTTQDTSKGLSGHHHRFEEDTAVLEYRTLDGGKIFAVLYMLFCGDVLRRKNAVSTRVMAAMLDTIEANEASSS